MKHTLVAAIFAIVLLTAVIGLTISIVKSNNVQTATIPIPQKLADMKLTQSIQGPDAISQISQLHKMNMELQGGIVAQYEGSGTKATLWIGVVDTPKQARQLINRMTESIQQGNNKTFGHLQQIEVKSITVYSVLGMGQIHYYYWRGNRTVWIAVDPNIAQQVLHEIIDATGIFD